MRLNQTYIFNVWMVIRMMQQRVAALRPALLARVILLGH